MFMDRPGMGVGFARFVSESKPYLSQVRSTILGYKEAELGTRVNQHNQFLSILTEVGILGFLPFALMYFFMFRMMARAYRIKCDCYDSEFVAAVWAVWAAYVSQVMFIEPRFFEFMNAFPFMFAGIIVGGYQRATTYRHHALQDERRRGREGTVR
jgi:O-antigen ligase